MKEVRVGHHQNLNKRILVALVVCSSLLGGIFLFLLYVWLFRHKTSKGSSSKSPETIGILLCENLSFLFPFIDHDCTEVFLFHLSFIYLLNLQKMQKGHHLALVMLKLTTQKWQIRRAQLLYLTFSCQRLQQTALAKIIFWVRVVLGFYTELVMMSISRPLLRKEIAMLIENSRSWSIWNIFCSSILGTPKVQCQFQLYTQIIFGSIVSPNWEYN